jgi:hypothetical protein
MTSRQSTLLRTALAVIALTAGAEARASPAWYDPEPLLASLRAPERVEVRKAFPRLDDLTLYDLDLELDLANSRFSLREVVYFTNREREALSDVVLRVYADSGNPQPLVTLRKGGCLDAECAVESPRVSVIRVRPRTALPPGGRLRIALELEGRLDQLKSERTSLLGQAMEAFAGAHGAAPRHTVLVAAGGIGLLSNFYPVVARRARKSWVSSETKQIGDVTSDELAHVRARVRTPPEVRVETNGLSVSESVVLHARGQGKHAREKQIALACGRDFAVVAGEKLQSLTRLAGDVVVSSHFFPKNRKAGEHVLDVATDSLARFEQRFGRYPFTHFSVAEAPLAGAGGIEFSGLAVVASLLYEASPFSGSGLGDLGQQLMGLLGQDNKLLQGLDLNRLLQHTASKLPARARRHAASKASAGRDRSATPDLLRSMREFVTAHEVAHQWWHGLIGSDSQADPFLDESLAQYSTLVYLEDRYGKTRADQEANTNVKLGYLMMRTMGTPDGPVSRPAAKFPSSLAYAGLVYGKAPFFFHELRQKLGDRAFFERLRSYATRHRFRTARPDALLEAFSAGGRRQEVAELARRWLEGAHGDEDIGGGGLLALLGKTSGQSGLGLDFGTRAVPVRR